MGRSRKVTSSYGRHLPDGCLQRLQAVLRCDWQRIRRVSEQLVKNAGLDELRVDWLLGDEKWGSRVGELTYQGAGSRVTPPQLSEAVAAAWAMGHLRRHGVNVSNPGAYQVASES